MGGPRRTTFYVCPVKALGIILVQIYRNMMSVLALMGSDGPQFGGIVPVYVLPLQVFPTITGSVDGISRRSEWIG